MTRKEALDFATEAHAGQRRNDGKDYITHPIAVAEMAESIFRRELGEYYLSRKDDVADMIYIVALFHDLVEDTYVTFEDLHKLFRDSVMHDAIFHLTRVEGETYYDFIKDMAEHGNLIGLIVKIADISHNEHDLEEGSLKDKYRFAKKMLEDALHSRWRIMIDQLTPFFK